MARKDRLVKVVEVSVGKNSTTVFGDIRESDLARDFLGISEATKELEVRYGQYTRRVLKSGKIEGVKVERKGYNKWYISRSSIRKYKARTSRKNALRNYTLRIKREEESKVREVLDTLGIDYDLELTYSSGKDK